MDQTALPTGRAAYAHSPMTARASNNILKSLVQLEIASGRSAFPHSPSKVAEKPRRENDAWHVVATDGSTSVITCKSACNGPKSNGSNQAIAEYLPRNLENGDECLPVEREAGVDLAYLNVEKETVSKLIAGMHALTVDEAATRLQCEIEMPSAKTDLQEIFKTDKVCVISQPKTAALKS
jgi:hypothetical protein